MKISTKGRYALRMLLDLAAHQDGGYIALKDIARRQDISKKYLEQIIPTLNKAVIEAALTFAVAVLMAASDCFLKNKKE